MKPCILDTNTLEFLFKGHTEVASRARQHLSLYGTLFITVITYYEVLKGLKHLETMGTTSRQLSRNRQTRFQEFCWQNQVLPLTEAACREGATIYAQRRQQGGNYLAGSDILIAGIARAGGYTIVTQNVKDFADITHLNVENWVS